MRLQTGKYVNTHMLKILGFYMLSLEKRRKGTFLFKFLLLPEQWMESDHKKVRIPHEMSPPTMRHIYRRPPFDHRLLNVILKSKFNLKRKKSTHVLWLSVFFSSEPCALPAIRNRDTTTVLSHFFFSPPPQTQQSDSSAAYQSPHHCSVSAVAGLSRMRQ